MSLKWGEVDPASSVQRRGAKATIRDVARALDISHTTVSRALADSPKISSETKERVRSVAEQLGYVPSASARTMRGRRSSLVALMVPDIQNDFYAGVAKVVANSLAARSMHLMLSITDDDPARELRELRVILEMRPAGVILVPTAGLLAETEALLGNLGTVQLLRRHPGIVGGTVRVDDRHGICIATRQLLDYGHTRIAYVGNGSETSTGRERLAGFQQALAERGLDPAAVMLGAPRPEFARHAVTTIMTGKARPTGLILAGPELTLGALQALRGLRLEWPRDVSLIGYHDPAWFELAEHGITTVRLPVEDIAVTATSLLISEALQEPSQEEGEQEPTEVVFTPALMLRGSTAPLGRR